jgi:hypothetical protein
MWLPDLLGAVVSGGIDVALTCGLVHVPAGVALEVFCAELLVSRRACAPDPARLPAARGPAAASHPLGQPPIQLPLRLGREGRTVTNETCTQQLEAIQIADFARHDCLRE